MNRKTYLLLFIFPITFTLGLFSSAQAQSNIIDEVIWIVGDEPILRSDIENQKLLLQSENQTIPGDPDCYLPELLAVQKLFLNQAKVDSITVDEGQISRFVEARLENVVSTYFGTKERMEEALNKKFSQIRDDWRRQSREGQIIEQMKNKIVENIRVNPSEIRSFFAATPTDSLPWIPTSVEVQVISIKPEISLSEIDNIKERLRGYSDEVNSGAREFTSIARIYSDDTNTALRGGEYGYVGRASLEEEFANIVFNMNPEGGRVSQVIETSQGYHIVQLIDKRGDMVNFRHILLKPKVESSAIETAITKADSIANEVRQGSVTFETAAEKFSDDQSSKINGGLMINTNEESMLMGSSRFEYEGLPQDISKVVYSLSPGQVSDAILATNANGSKEVIVVKLRSKTEGHRANMVNDFQTIKAMAQRKKEQKALDEWILKKQKETYVSIKPGYQACDFKYPGWSHSKE